MFGSSETFQNKSKIITRRMFILSVAKIAVFIAIISRLFYLQISENIKYRSLSDRNRLREWKIAPQRGIIEDYFGTKIAKNTQVFQLHMIPEDVPNLEELFFKLSKIIDFNERKKRNLIKRLKKRKTKNKYDKKDSEKTSGKLIVKEYPTASANANHFRSLLDELQMKKKFKPDNPQVNN